MSKCIRKPQFTRTFTLLSRLWSGPQTVASSSSENKIKETLRLRFPRAKTIEVADVSGGCGAMFDIMIESTEFEGLNIVKQHRLVNDALKEEIKDMHGLRIHTSVPS